MSVRRRSMLYRTLLRVLPKRIRSTYGAEMEELFEEALEDAARKSRMVWLMAWIRGAADVLACAYRFRTRRAPRSGESGLEGRARKYEAGAWSLREGLTDLLQEVRFGLRSLSKSATFSLIAVGSLALGIGGNTALASVMHTLWLKPVPGIHGADRIVEVLTTVRGREYEVGSYPAIFRT